MTIDATFWVAISFFIFLGILVYLKVPQKINNSLTDKINEMKKELNEAERLKFEAKKIIEDSQKKLDLDIENKKKKFNDEIENELTAIEEEI